MEWIINNWMNVVFVILAIIIVVYAIMTGKVKEWLKWAVVDAEEYLGTGTGQLKLREVYDSFISAFPVFSKIVPFFIFSKWVDMALEWMRYQLENNPKIASYVKGE